MYVCIYIYIYIYTYTYTSSDLPLRRRSPALGDARRAHGEAPTSSVHVLCVHYHYRHHYHH